MPETGATVLNVVEKLDQLTDRQVVSVDDILDAFGRSAFLPTMMVPALLVVSPLSGIPFFSSICGLTIALIASQLLIQRQRLWLPGFIRRRRITGARLHRGADRLRGVAAWIDRHSRDRVKALVSRKFLPVIFLACMVSGLSMPFLEVMPFSSSILGMAVLCFTTAVIAADGLFAVMGFAFMTLAAGIPVAVVTGVASLS